MFPPEEYKSAAIKGALQQSCRAAGGARLAGRQAGSAGEPAEGGGAALTSGRASRLQRPENETRPPLSAGNRPARIHPAQVLYSSSTRLFPRQDREATSISVHRKVFSCRGCLWAPAKPARPFQAAAGGQRWGCEAISRRKLTTSDTYCILCSLWFELHLHSPHLLRFSAHTCTNKEYSQKMKLRWVINT